MIESDLRHMICAIESTKSDSNLQTPVLRKQRKDFKKIKWNWFFALFSKCPFLPPFYGGKIWSRNAHSWSKMATTLKILSNRGKSEFPCVKSPEKQTNSSSLTSQVFSIHQSNVIEVSSLNFLNDKPSRTWWCAFQFLTSPKESGIWELKKNLEQWRTTYSPYSFAISLYTVSRCFLLEFLKLPASFWHFNKWLNWEESSSNSSDIIESRNFRYASFLAINSFSSQDVSIFLKNNGTN